MFKHVIIGLTLAGLSISSIAFAEEVSAENTAVIAAESWVELIDEGLYDESWEQASGYFKAIMKQEAWKNSIQPLRGSLGAVLSRRLKSHAFATTMPGAPDGEYVIIQFETSFENKKIAIETIMPMVDEDGAWRVAGYYIK